MKIHLTGSEDSPYTACCGIPYSQIKRGDSHTTDREAVNCGYASFHVAPHRCCKQNGCPPPEDENTPETPDITEEYELGVRQGILTLKCKRCPWNMPFPNGTQVSSVMQQMHLHTLTNHHERRER